MIQFAPAEHMFAQLSPDCILYDPIYDMQLGAGVMA